MRSPGCQQIFSPDGCQRKKKPTSSENLLFEANLSNLVGQFGDPGAIRTRDVPLRRAKKCSPSSASECLQVPKFQRFPPFSDVRISSKNRLFYPVRVSRVLAASNFGGRPFSHDVRFCQQICSVFLYYLFNMQVCIFRKCGRLTNDDRISVRVCQDMIGFIPA